MGDTEHGARRTAYRTAYRTGYCDGSSGSAQHEHGIPCAGLLGAGGSWAVAGSCLVTAVLCAGVAVSWGRVGEGGGVCMNGLHGEGELYRMIWCTGLYGRELHGVYSHSPHSTPLPTDFSTFSLYYSSKGSGMVGGGMGKSGNEVADTTKYSVV